MQLLLQPGDAILLDVHQPEVEFVHWFGAPFAQLGADGFGGLESMDIVAGKAPVARDQPAAEEDILLLDRRHGRDLLLRRRHFGLYGVDLGRQFLGLAVDRVVKRILILLL